MCETQTATVRATRAALAALDVMVAQGGVPPTVTGPLRREYEQRVANAESRMAELHLAQDELLMEEPEVARKQLLIVQKDALL